MMAETGIISDKGKRILKRILIGALVVYALLVTAFETWLALHFLRWSAAQA